MSFRLGITAPDGWFDCPLPEAIGRAADAGAEGIEFFDWEGADLDAVADASAEHGVDVFGTLAAGAGSEIMDPDAPCMVRPEHHEQAVSDIERSLAAAAEVDADHLVVTVGQDQRDLEPAVQQTALTAVLRAVAPAAEAHGVTVVVEPLNVRVDHPGYFLRTTGRAVEVVDAVDSPRVKILYDVYHQQITEGDVIRRFRDHHEHVGHVHVADNPGRHEPGTGELDYEHVFEAIADTDYDGWVSCEFSPTGSPEAAFRETAAMADRARGGD
jgi:hydroxypyruvate isomerase